MPAGSTNDPVDWPPTGSLGLPAGMNVRQARDDDIGVASGMGGMVKRKGEEWEERTDGIMQILRTVCLKCTPHNIHHFDFLLFVFVTLQMMGLFYRTPQP